MNVPLSVVSVEQFGKEKLSIWNNKKEKTINSPIKPYLYSYVNYQNHMEVKAKVTVIEGIALSTYKPKSFYKYEFKTRDDLVKFRDMIRETQGTGVLFEDNIPFTIRNRIDNADIYTEFPHTEPLVFLFFDVEQSTKKGKMFPDYTDTIISIAYCTNDKQIKSFYLNPGTESDKELIERFRDAWKKINPDVIILFNKNYDIPTLFNRCKRNGIEPSSFTKNGVEPRFGASIHIPGCVVYDVYDSAEKDQSLSGNVINRGLKEVSDYYGFKTEHKVLTPKEISNSVGTKELIDYNKDDVRRLLLLFDVYWPNIEFNAHDLKIPLDHTVDLSVTDLALVVVGDEYKKRNIISDGDNHSRYPEIFQRKKKPLESNYQGALVDIYRSGKIGRASCRERV